MSLTSQLKDSHSAISRFLAEQLPDTRAVLADYRTRLARFPAPLKPRAEAGMKPEYRMLGHTIDHRLRISLGAPTGSPIKEGIVRAVLDDNGWPSREVIRAVQKAGDTMLDELARYESDAGQPLCLASAEEDRLIRLCHVASSFEAIFRHCGWMRGNSLGTCAAEATLDDLIDAVAGYVVDDIRQQMELAARPGPFENMRLLPATARVCGPVFDGSLHVGGADADFILDGALIDCKATIRPERLNRAEIYQLAGYLLLDYSDAHTITTVALYLSRQGALIDWSVADFLALLGARHELPTLREACRHALTDGTHGSPPPPPDPSRPLPRPRSAPAAQPSLFDELD
ncbi:hypothetical protein KBP30_40940 [Streptomyces sp. Go40/10]|uniref:hypothetical protein n=1 Tax=Streptomyces sp. Go40/10 TaxID=2825844 RepID=UPI001E2E67BB|nr:hypothetical protein [Streptomyces sp. Go40/10]UFR07116.1 hypothetical protein KBP30_40940 [Streptomyces sp. Go40/10]